MRLFVRGAIGAPLSIGMSRIRSNGSARSRKLSPSLGALCLLAVLTGLLAPHLHAAAQNAIALSQVKKVYVESFGKDNSVAKLQNRTIEQLRRKSEIEIVASPTEADAVIKGTGSVWVAGYTSTDPRSHATTREPIYQGYLSVEVTGKDGDPLWSYLVTPGKFLNGDITRDLADHLVDKLLEARKQSEAVIASPYSQPSSKVTLTAAGSTFPAPLYRKWFESFHERHPDVEVDYTPTGSDAGLKSLLNGTLDFAGSDVRLSEDRITQSGKKYLQFATVVGAVVPVYNVTGVARSLNFTPEILAGIYLGKIKKWDDPAIRESNRDVALPGTEIAVVHRSDGSGTTFAWTDYLAKLSPEWKAAIGSGTSVQWPVGIGAAGNEGVADRVQHTASSIGYVELAYALQHQLNYGAIRNSAGKFILADLSSVTEAAADVAPADTAASFASITNAPGKNAYPIASFTWWIFPQDLAGDKREALNELLEWMLSSGQKECSSLAYAPLPHEVASRQLQFLASSK